MSFFSPEPVLDVVFVLHVNLRVSAGRQQVSNLLRAIGVEHENLAAVGAGGT
jgi:hypothetical protein